MCCSTLRLLHDDSLSDRKCPSPQNFSDRKNFEATDTSGRTASHRVGAEEWNNTCDSLANGEEPLKLDTTSSSPRNGARPLVLDTQSGKAPGDQQSVPENEERNKG